MELSDTVEEEEEEGSREGCHRAGHLEKENTRFGKEVEISTIDSLMHQYYREYLKSNQLTLKTANSVEQYKALVQAIQLVSEKYPEIRLINSKYSSFLLDELAWLKACSIDSEDMYQNIDRTGRASGSRGNPQKLIKNSPLRAAIFELLTTYNRLLEKDGLIDFKEMNIKEYWQVIHNMVVCEAEQWDFGSYLPFLKPDHVMACLVVNRCDVLEDIEKHTKELEEAIRRKHALLQQQ